MMDPGPYYRPLERKRHVRPRFTGRQAAAALAALADFAGDLRADGAHATARVLEAAADAIMAEAAPRAEGF